MLTYDPRKISTKVYRNLKETKARALNETDLSKQKGQAVELYTYAATWGLLRLKGEEPALSNERQKQAVVQCFFKTLGELAFPNENPNPLLGVETGLERLSDPRTMSASAYLGLTGLALQIAREFSFWAESLYIKPKTNTSGDDSTSSEETDQ